MTNLTKKFTEVCKEQDNQFEHENKKIFQNNIKQLFIKQNIEIINQDKGFSEQK